MNKLVEEIKKNKKYSGIENKVIVHAIGQYFKKKPKNKKFVEKPKSEKFKKMVSEIRALLFFSHSLFYTEKKSDRNKYLEELKKIKDLKSSESIRLHKLILSTSVSAKERIYYYPELYKKIFSITGKLDSIADIGAGINPISFIFMGLDNVKYYAYEISKSDCDFINNYFELLQKQGRCGCGLVGGRSEILDLKQDNINKIPSVDVVFLFKVLDVIEEKGHKLAEKIIKNLKAKFIIVSFATKTVSSKRMNFPQRGWIERMLQRINLKFEKLDFENEVYYVIKK